MTFLQVAIEQVAERDPFWYGVAITALGIAILVERLIRGKPMTKIRGATAITVMLMGAGISFGFLERLIAPISKIIERFGG